MTKKRILLIHNDRILLKLYREKLEENGFDVDATRELDQAPKIIAKRTPDLLLLDLVFLRGSPNDFIKALRAQTSTARIPILILPTTLVEMANAAVQTGATKAIEGCETPIASAIRAVTATLGLRELGEAQIAALSKTDDFWANTVLANALDSINQMRHCLPGVSAQPPELPAIRELWSLVHAFAEKALLLPFKPLVQFATALNFLVRDIEAMPEQLNPSTLRTVGHALDFLAAISRPEYLPRLVDASLGNVLVVDDEESLRYFMVSALQFIGIKADCAESPSLALERLKSFRPDLIFLDIGMPEMDGFELCGKIRAIEAHKRTPIIFITGMSTFQNKAKASLCGGNDFVPKPFNLRELNVKALIWLFRGQLKMT